ncbi:Phosphoesterase OS=Streptomyces fumanus OX=67302 GN=GCM10018772_53710 PE=4 SV=1 [Streptomyces fumanus]
MAERYEYLRDRLTRRRALVTAGAVAGGLLTGCSGAAAGPGCARPAPPASAAGRRGRRLAPFGRHLAFGADPMRQMRVSWQVPAAGAPPVPPVACAPMN